MKTTLILSLQVVLVFAFSLNCPWVEAQQTPAFLGTWKMNTEGIKFTEEMKAAGITEEMLKQKIHFLNEMRIVFSSDGKMTTIRDGFPTSIAWKQLTTSETAKEIYKLEFNDNVEPVEATVTMTDARHLTIAYSVSGAPNMELVKVSDEHRVSKSNPINIGYKAPNIDVEHWIEKPNFEISFGDGSVYLIEFWATWCGPCLEAMPKLAELQSKYQNGEVRVIAVSNESKDTIDGLISRQASSASDSTNKESLSRPTLADVAKRIAIGTDPDGSTMGDFMVAANLRAIPTTFIIGKTGVVEWIGTSSDAVDVVSRIVRDQWDRNSFAAKFKGHQRAYQEFQNINMMMSKKDYAGAIKLADELIEIADDRMRESLKATRDAAIKAQGN